MQKQYFLPLKKIIYMVNRGINFGPTWPEARKTDGQRETAALKKEAAMSLFDRLKKRKSQSALQYLNNEAEATMRLSELVDAFERMCEVPIKSINRENEMLLFETGTFTFSGQSMFHFSLVRQWPNEDKEYCQLHLDIQYQPDSKNKLFSAAVWNEDIHTDFFAFVRSSGAYLTLVDDVIAKVEIYQDET